MTRADSVTGFAVTYFLSVRKVQMRRVGFLRYAKTLPLPYAAGSLGVIGNAICDALLDRRQMPLWGPATHMRRVLSFFMHFAGTKGRRLLYKMGRRVTRSAGPSDGKAGLFQFP